MDKAGIRRGAQYVERLVSGYFSSQFVLDYVMSQLSKVQTIVCVVCTGSGFRVEVFAMSARAVGYREEILSSITWSTSS